MGLFTRKVNTVIVTAEPEPRSYFYVYDLEKALAQLKGPDERWCAAQSFLMQFSVRKGSKEILGALSMLSQLAKETGSTPVSLYDTGVLLNLRNATYAAAAAIYRRTYEERLERAMLILETCHLTGEMIDFFIVFCLQWVLKQEDSKRLAAHYAQRAACLRTSGTLTQQGWDILRHSFLKEPAEHIFDAIQAHLASRGDTEVHFPRPSQKK